MIQKRAGFSRFPLKNRYCNLFFWRNFLQYFGKEIVEGLLLIFNEKIGCFGASLCQMKKNY